ncbi:MAG TPA: nuclear transport factor 2 family protein [Candidatus Acidoferrales bacterium]|jgi:hypothetical protein|nr:nuclear transport factor 2 family protein [Candidatus Acidoferrales bacterium]
MNKSSKRVDLRARPPGILRASDVKRFLAQYKEAWETRNADLAANLFTRDAQYQQGPFGEPIVSREAIHDYWRAATGRQEDIHFTVSKFLRIGYVVVAEWTCAYRDRSSHQHKQLAGMFLADFYGKQVRTFREYWLSRTL